MQFDVVNCSWILEWLRYEDLMKELVFKPRKFLLSRAQGGSVIFHEQQGKKGDCIEGRHLSDVFRKMLFIL